MLRALMLTMLLGSVPRACSCTAPAEWVGHSTSASTEQALRVTAQAPTERDTDSQATGTPGGGYVLPEGIGPASGGGKCTVPELTEVDLLDPDDMNLEERLFGQKTGEISVKAPEPCP